MGHRTELICVASGIINSFSSRNNDIDGYWGLGKLYKSLESEESKIVTIELTTKVVTPDIYELKIMSLSYSEMLTNLLYNKKIPINWIMSATITSEFEAKYQHHHFWRRDLGKPCNLTCTIVDDMGNIHTAKAYVNCLPHNPHKELRSTRAE
ncbi:hypothetical protein ACP6EV_18950 [Aeromonas hydrophila]|uniref:hypothetical protein n=1 Tax=Aeromonas hydrophila TaxID=644 RepID=UPI003CEAE5FD